MCSAGPNVMARVINYFGILYLICSVQDVGHIYSQSHFWIKLLAANMTKILEKQEPKVHSSSWLTFSLILQNNKIQEGKKVNTNIVLHFFHLYQYAWSSCGLAFDKYCWCQQNFFHINKSGLLKLFYYSKFPS